MQMIIFIGSNATTYDCVNPTLNVEAEAHTHTHTPHAASSSPALNILSKAPEGNGIGALPTFSHASPPGRGSPSEISPDPSERLKPLARPMEGQRIYHLQSLLQSMSSATKPLALTQRADRSSSAEIQLRVFFYLILLLFFLFFFVLNKQLQLSSMETDLKRLSLSYQKRRIKSFKHVPMQHMSGISYFNQF